ncbi:hypothetical protein RND81_10G152800 [Saponaria officinalis]|uniref:Uncharacterized protein n=1 Tax=Saponaria officinalis TaxID=3572 RepID=A0AAW1I4Y2_SAPOF
MVETRASKRKASQEEHERNLRRLRGEKSPPKPAPTVDSPEFSWSDPFRFSVPGWIEGESPLPEAMDQDEDEDCIPASIKTNIEIQAAMFKKEFPDIDVPKISYAYLRDTMETMEEEDKTLTNMLSWVQTNGAVEEGSYNEETKETFPARRYFLDWDTGFDPSRGHYIQGVKRSVLKFGAVIGEFEMREDFDQTANVSTAVRMCRHILEWWVTDFWVTR